MGSLTECEPQFLSGANFGLSPSVQVHRTANIIGRLRTGPNCRIDGFVTIIGDVTLGANCHIATGVCIFGSYGFEMGDGCALSPGVKVFTATEDVDSGYLSSFVGGLEPRGMKQGPVRFGKYVVIGANSVVMPNVTIADEVQIGSLSFVNRSLAGQAIYVGAPARFLRARPKLRYG